MDDVVSERTPLSADKFQRNVEMKTILTIKDFPLKITDVDEAKPVVVNGDIGLNTNHVKTFPRKVLLQKKAAEDDLAPAQKTDKKKKARHVSLDPHAVLLDAAVEGELELVKQLIREVDNPSKPNSDGITALHNAVCACHDQVVHFLVQYGADINSPDSHGWLIYTPEFRPKCDKEQKIWLIPVSSSQIVGADYYNQV
ncbi:hypothetical protein OS493_022521 [Desmophyllum pertusum]|uniref:Uncharacterized protein n=1 Tax=Desmophyllum pertusum TaxID=174260 RepID=A0A9X0CWG4_9CNID|nr:hypothetical protein OS493_022521 [Desmophyllum pertusum]